MHHSPGKVDLVPLGDVQSASGAQVVHQGAFAHVLCHQQDAVVIKHKAK